MPSFIYINRLDFSFNFPCSYAVKRELLGYIYVFLNFYYTLLPRLQAHPFCSAVRLLPDFSAVRLLPDNLNAIKFVRLLANNLAREQSWYSKYGAMQGYRM